jgi:hypothetical protein
MAKQTKQIDIICRRSVTSGFRDMIMQMVARATLDMAKRPELQPALAAELTLRGWTCTPPAEQPKQPAARRKRGGK